MVNVNVLTDVYGVSVIVKSTRYILQMGRREKEKYHNDNLSEAMHLCTNHSVFNNF